jgi:predicted O-methyltransferase YrrM
MPSPAQPSPVQVDAFFESTLIAEDAQLAELSARNAAAGLPAIAVSPTQAKALALLVRLMQARNVLEVGTLGGYSGVHIARELPSSGRLTTLEINPIYAQVARDNFTRLGLAPRVDLRIGPALDTLRELAAAQPRSFDLIFIDADKPNNPAYFSLATQLIRPRGVILVDNVVRDGNIADESSTDPAVLGTRTMMQAISKMPHVTATALQTQGSKGYDGFLMAVVD